MGYLLEIHKAYIWKEGNIKGQYPTKTSLSISPENFQQSNWNKGVGPT